MPFEPPVAEGGKVKALFLNKPVISSVNRECLYVVLNRGQQFQVIKLESLSFPLFDLILLYNWQMKHTIHYTTIFRFL